MNATFVQTEDESIEIYCCEEIYCYVQVVSQCHDKSSKQFLAIFFLANGFDGLMTID